MAIELSTATATVACQAFIAAMRREWVRLGGQGDCPVKMLEEYPMQQRNAMVSSMGVAMTIATRKPA